VGMAKNLKETLYVSGQLYSYSSTTGYPFGKTSNLEGRGRHFDLQPSEVRFPLRNTLIGPSGEIFHIHDAKPEASDQLQSWQEWFFPLLTSPRWSPKIRSKRKIPRGRLAI
jgi:hypothetical protein